jgi:hypothetical protein
VASDLQISANRKNAAKSTGPRSEAGQAQSSRNAVRHGLSVSIGSLQEFQDDIDALAAFIEQDGAGKISKASARVAAEAQLDLVRIRQVKAELLQARVCQPNDPPTVFDLDEQLDSLERYERRALSRRKAAFKDNHRFALLDFSNVSSRANTGDI